MKKFQAYGVKRQDEREAMIRVGEKYGVEIRMTKKPLNLETLQLAQGGAGILSDGDGYIGRELLDGMVAMGIYSLATRSIGYNHIEVDYANEVGVRVCNSEYAPNGVADYTMMLMLMVLRRFKETFLRTQQHDYSIANLMGRELKDLTVGIVGTGRIGRTVIQSLSGFGCKILAYDPYEHPDIEYVSWETLLKTSDIISLHVPLCHETHHLIAEAELEMMKEGVILINCSRGELMKTVALIEGLQSGRIGGLGLDVIEQEQTGGPFPIATFPNVILTPHIAFYTDVAVEEIVESSVEGLIAFGQGFSWKNQVE